MNSEKILKNEVCDKTGGMDMCKALEDLYAEGIEQGVQALIEMCKEFGCSQEDTRKRLLEKILITEECAEIYMEKYW